jgi:CheY-like chemotaxis protein
MNVAESGEDAIPMLQTKKYDAILMDINLRKGLDESKFTKMIRQLPSYKKTPIIAITAYASTGDREEFLANGMDFYISKPYKKHEILKLLKEAIPEK